MRELNNRLVAQSMRLASFQKYIYLLSCLVRTTQFVLIILHPCWESQLAKFICDWYYCNWQGPERPRQNYGPLDSESPLGFTGYSTGRIGELQP